MLAELAIPVWVASLLGSLHCAGMCGPLVGCGAIAGDGSAWARLAAYHGGRWVGYAALGLVAGIGGGLLDLGGAWVGLQRLALLVAASGLIVFAAWTLWLRLGVRGGAPGAAARGRFYIRGFGVLNRLSGPRRAAGLGALSMLLPCGWLWAFVLVAAGSGSAWRGVVVMTAFWAGSLPALLVVGSLVQRLAPSVRRRLPALGAAVILIGGIVMLAQRWDLRRAPLQQVAPGIERPEAAAAAAGADLSLPTEPTCH